MKLLLDFLPLILFFATFKLAQGQKDAAADLANTHFAALTSGGVVTPDQAPMLLATLMAIVATLGVVLWLKLRGRPIDLMLWVTLAIVVVLGGLTVWFHDETFIKWKPSGVYWMLGLVYWASQALFGKNILRAAIGEQMSLPDAVWRRLNTGWVVFFGVMGLLNLAVAYSVSTETWVNFKVFGATGLSLLFIVAQGFYIHRYLPQDEAKPADAPGSTH